MPTSNIFGERRTAVAPDVRFALHLTLPKPFADANRIVSAEVDLDI